MLEILAPQLIVSWGAALEITRTYDFRETQTVSVDVYFYTLATKCFSRTKKLALLKETRLGRPA